MQDGEVRYYIDGKDEDSGNWLRFINCARTEAEQNLVAYQYRNDIYYRLIGAILFSSKETVFCNSLHRMKHVYLKVYLFPKFCTVHEINFCDVIHGNLYKERLIELSINQLVPFIKDAMKRPLLFSSRSLFTGKSSN